MIYILWDYACEARMRIHLADAKFGCMPPNHRMESDWGQLIAPRNGFRRQK